MRVLFTSHALDYASEATILPIRELAAHMNGRDHDVICFSRTRGEVSEALEAMGIAVVTEMSEIPVGWEPEIIHGHHEWETTIAAMRFPTVPAISVCRSKTDWKESPCTAPNVIRYIAVNTDIRDWLRDDEYIRESEIDLVLNGVDLHRFPERKTYRKRPEMAFVFADRNREVDYCELIRQACESEGVGCEIIDDPMVNPARFHPLADLVFASGKVALEAIATGATVIPCGEPGTSPEPVTLDNLLEMRKAGFSGSLLSQPHSVDTYRNRIRSYKPKLAKKITRLTRQSAAMELVIDQLLAIYERTITVWKEGHGEDLATFETFTEWAAAHFERLTWPYKIGRTSQEIWRNDDAPGDRGFHARPFTPEGEKIEAHRILDTLRKTQGRKPLHSETDG